MWQLLQPWMLSSWGGGIPSPLAGCAPRQRAGDAGGRVSAFLGLALHTVPLLPFLHARGLIASCICQPQGFPASTALPGIEALGFQLSVINPKEKKERERGEAIYSFQPSLAYVADQVQRFLLE